MRKIAWDDSLALGITLVDEQHKQWIEKLNSLSSAIESDQEAQHISETLNYLVSYSEFHFAAEEELMAAHNYPELERHKLAHKKFRDTLTELLQLQVGKPDALRRVSDSVNNFQISWLKSHITKVDRKFADFLDANVAAGVPEQL